jgi:hypothetical protein
MAQGDFEDEIEHDGNLEQAGVDRPLAGGTDSDVVDVMIKQTALDFGDERGCESFSETAADGEAGAQGKADVGVERLVQRGFSQASVEIADDSTAEFDPAVFRQVGLIGGWGLDRRDGADGGSEEKDKEQGSHGG